MKNINKPEQISVIISSYNQIEWLEKTLWGYCCQSRPADEIIIADDGSHEDTRLMIESFKDKLPIKHVWHEDKGFRKTEILNKALVASTSEYLIFTDQDCIPRADFIESHERYAQKGYFLSGGVFRLTMDISQKIIRDDIISGRTFNFKWILKQKQHITFKITKLVNNKYFTCFMNKITTAKATWNGCNASGWRTDLLHVNGFNEEMQYGGEDRELGERLINYGTRAKQIRYSAILIHLDHSRPYKNDDSIAKNIAIRKNVRKNKTVKTPFGIAKTLMLIGFDAKRAFINYTGLGNYSRYIIDNLSAYFNTYQYRLYSPKKKENPRMITICERENISNVFPKGLYARFSSLWRTTGMTADLLRDGVQLYHGLSNELPVGLHKKGIRSVVTIHDLIFLRCPQFYKAPDRVIYTQKFGYACRDADRIVAVSECTKRDIVTFFGVAPDKISVIYQGCDKSFTKKLSQQDKQQICRKYSLPETFILSVGTIEPRKNLMLAVKALSQIEDSVHLVAVGKQTNYAEEVKKYAVAHGLQNRLHILSNIPFSYFPAIYQSAAVFVFPSFFEGFGIPIIEALHSGTPVIAATGSCLEEAGGPNSIYVDPNNDEQLADNIRKILYDSDLQAKMITNGQKYVARFDDKLLAEQMMDLYLDIFNEKKTL